MTPYEGISLSEFLKRQGTTMPAYGVPQTEGHSQFMAFLNNAVVSLMLEGGEAAAEIMRANRPWKRKDFDEIRPLLIEETVDVFFFLLEVWTMLGLSEEDIWNVFSQKLEVNMRRVLSTADKSDREIALKLAAKALYPTSVGSDINLSEFDKRDVILATSLCYNFERTSDYDRLRWPTLVAAIGLLRSMYKRGAAISLEEIANDPTKV